MAFAAGLFGLFFLANGVFLRAARARAHDVAFVEARGRSYQGSKRSWSSLSERDRKIVGLAEGVAEDLGSQEGGGAAARVELSPSSHGGEVAARGPKAMPRADVIPAHGRVLVLDDLTTSVDGRVLELLGTRLGERGFTVVGKEADEVAAASAVELLAGARHALGLGRAEEPETQANLQRFLDGTAGLDALILVSRAEKEPEHLYRVFVRTPALTQPAAESR